MWKNIYSTKIYKSASRMKYSIRETAAAAPDLFCGKRQCYMTKCDIPSL